MDLEQLTKHQIVLLTLLVSFMTSIATGIVTVSLMDQAPTGVTKIVNQVVERTVQTVVPPTQSAAAAAAPTVEKTVVVKDDDLVAQSIAAVQKSVIRITAAGGKDLIARGVIIDAKGTAITDRKALAQSGADSFEAILQDGERVPLTVVKDASSSPIATLSLQVGTSTGFAPAALADMTKLQLGQSVIRIGGVGSDTVGEGVIALLPNKGDNSQLIEASVSAATPGSVLITLFGQVIGITTDDAAQSGADFYTVPSPAQASAPSAHATSSPSNS